MALICTNHKDVNEEKRTESSILFSFCASSVYSFW
uniref:Uncharacterized protein n=1 Tax=Myoviridae sp. ctWiL39 TaxID=2825120 RepID=A0A8S5PXA4_9CAUD|nr:MAG TPA: hypothetical protein [Myoviridae sp. ctWiL39]